VLTHQASCDEFTKHSDDESDKHIAKSSKNVEDLVEVHQGVILQWKKIISSTLSLKWRLISGI
jgi:hypothetical protein